MPKKEELRETFMKCFILLFTLLGSLLTAEESSKPFVIADIHGQAGNNFFQIATASALAWDNGAEPFFPQLASLPTLYQHYFSRCKIFPPTGEIAYKWVEPDSHYHPIFYQPDLKITGYFQSWKYFNHYRDRLLALFAPISKDIRYIRKKYGTLLNRPDTVGIQIRYYFEDLHGERYPQYGKDYLEKTMALFPKTSTFIVSSNHLEFAKAEVPTEGRTVIFLESDPAYIDFYILTLCQHNIITNSTFGWWSAYLNQNSNHVVFYPKHWAKCDTTDLYPENWVDTADLCPENWIPIEADPINPALIKNND